MTQIHLSVPELTIVGYASINRQLIPAVSTTNKFKDAKDFRFVFNSWLLRR